MKFYTSICAIVIACTCVACHSSGSGAEEPAGQMLGQARELLAQKQYDAARDTIYSLRRLYPSALNARRAAILTLDSIELMATRDSLIAYEQQLDEARELFKGMAPRENGQTNQAYYDQQRKVMAMEQHFDELCAKVKFFLRKIDIDSQKTSQG